MVLYFNFILMEIKKIDNKFTLKILNWKINNEFLLSSINSDLNSIFHQKWEIYKNNYFLYNQENNLFIEQFIWSKTRNWLNYIINFLNKLYWWDISYSSKIDNDLFNKKYDKIYSISLKNLFYFQLKKPWIAWDWLWEAYQSSSRIIEDIFKDFKDFLHDWEILNISLEYWYSNYSNLLRKILYRFKEIFHDFQYIEELNSSFSDKLEFLEFDFIIKTNSKNSQILEKIIKKNLDVYNNKFNGYKLNKWNLYLSNFYKKVQIDTLIAHGTILPVKSNFTQINESKIIPISNTIIKNDLIKKDDKSKWYEILLWKAFKTNIIENKVYLKQKEELQKNNHILLIWWSWSWKTFWNASNKASKIIHSIIENKLSFENDKITKYWDTHIIIDPHSNYIPHIDSIINSFRSKENIKTLDDNFYEINYTNKVEKNKDRVLIFNPLFCSSLLDIKEKNEFRNKLNLHIEANLESLKWYYSDWDFWSKNQDILVKLFLFLIICNLIKFQNYKDLKEIYKKNWKFSDEEYEKYYKNSKLFTLWDINKVLVWFIKTKTLENEYIFYLKQINNSNNIIIQDYFKEISEDIDLLIDKSKLRWEFDSTLNKLAIFWKNWFLYKTFWGDILNEYTLDLEKLFLENSYKTKYISFSLWRYSSKEKSIISNYLMTYSYTFWTKRDFLDPKLWKIYFTIDEFSSLIKWKNIIDTLWKVFAEIRKYGLWYELITQSFQQKWIEDIVNNIWVFQIFSINSQDINFIIEQLNSTNNTIKLTIEDIANLKRWQFILHSKLINGNVTITCESMNYQDKNDLKEIIDFDFDDYLKLLSNQKNYGNKNK